MTIDVDAYYRRYGPMVLRRCRKLLGQEQDALDAMQDKPYVTYGFDRWHVVWKKFLQAKDSQRNDQVSWRPGNGELNYVTIGAPRFFQER